MKHLSESELQKLLQYVKEKASDAKRRGATRAVIDEILVLLLLKTGLRANELCNLSIADLVTEHGKNTICVRDDCGNVSRAVDVTLEMAEYLRRFIGLYRRKAKPDDPLLVSERGTRFSYMSLYNKIKKIGRQAKIGNLHPRILRATYIVRLYNIEQDLRFVQRQAGHAYLRTTAIYAIAGSGCELHAVTPDQAYSLTTEQIYRSSRQVTPEKRQAVRPAKHEEKLFVKDFQHTEKCEACGKSIGAEIGTKIDSGQILCPDCLKELRSK